MKIDKEIESLFKKVRVLLGAPVRQVQLDNEQLCDLLEISIEDYAEKVQNWMIENQWTTLYGKSVNNTDMAYALSTRTLDLMKDYSSWFSKGVGLQQHGKWELKKDFITVEAGKQNYIIPAGREINKVMWVNPPTSQAALFANYGGIDIGFGGGYAQLGGGANGPVGGFYTAPAADVAYLATDIAYKNRLLRSDLVYKITGGPNGTKILHLISTPGSKLSFGYVGGSLGAISMIGCEVWYTFYDVNPNGDDIDECRIENPDIILSPDQVPLAKMNFPLFNEPTKVIIRKLLVAKAKQTLGLIRGTFSGKIQIPNAEMLLDYQMLLNQGEKEYSDAMEELTKRLERMTPKEIMKAQAELHDAIRSVQKGVPLGIYVI